MPTPRSVAEIKSKLLNPSLTSHFEVTIPIPKRFRDNSDYLDANGLSQFVGAIGNQGTLNLLCCDTVLPGSNIGTMEITNDYHGVTVRHANRRIYDDRIDLTFYVDAENYTPIRYFEVWMKYIVGESINQKEGSSRPGSKSPNYFYRLNYPENYIDPGGLTVTKFERTGKDSKYTGSRLTYEFINSFPISITSMPVSYETSSLLKCTVSFSYIRYVLNPTLKEPPHEDDSKDSITSTTEASSPAYQANYNNYQFNPAVFENSASASLSQDQINAGYYRSAEAFNDNPPAIREEPLW